MSKLGDLIVRLRLQPEDYEKGLKKAEKNTKGFSGRLSKSISVIKAAWAAVGVAVVAAAKTMVTQMSKASNNVGDFMAVKAKQIGAVWQTMLTSITAGFDNFLERAKIAARAAKALQEAEDAEFEMLNSVKLRRAEIAQTLVQLEIDSRDATKSYEDRKKAAEKYLEIVKDIYDIEKNYYKGLAAQSAKTWLESASTPQGNILGYNESNAGALYKFLKDYGADTGLQEAVKNYREAWKEAGDLWFTRNKGKSALRWVNENRQDWEQTQFRRFALDLGWAYEEQKNDELNGTKLVDVIEKYLNAVAAYDAETKKMQNNLNSLTAQLEKGTGLDLSEETEQVDRMTESLEKLNGIQTTAVAINIPDIIPDDWLERNREKIDEALAEVLRLQGITEDINMMFENAVVGSLSNATQAITDAIAGIEGADASQVLSAFLQPFANTLVQLGEMLIAEGMAIEVFKESLKELDGVKALAAGAALVAMGAALNSGIRALGSSAGSSSTASSSVSSSTVSNKEYKSEQTIYVKGKISGADIVISGDNQRNKWSR